ncbi:MAG: AEC family transporter [Rubrivivax sp.]|jgi:malonate transporter|nr:AEC family transporter [Rubrivivax sp.]MCL4698880.1 AEC family transporter [Burkholderiaceae bacterium]
MQAILAVTIPFFALVLAGYLAARRHVLPESAIPGLNAFVLYFALPCMLFRFGNATPVFELLNPVAFGVWLLAALLIVLVTIAFSLNKRVGLKDASFGALVAAFPNTGFMGLPLLAALLGPVATAPMMTTMLVDLFVTSSLCLALASAAGAAQDHGAGARAALVRALRGAVSNPLPWAIALGAASSAAGFRLTGPLEVIVRLLADAATPVALFTIGAVLFRAGQHAHHRTAPADFVPVALVKLALHPLLVFALALAARSLGLPLTGLQVVVLTLTAALPSASNVSLLAERFGADNGRVARIIMTSTVLAFVSFTTLAWLFGVQPGG